MTDSFNLIN